MRNISDELSNNPVFWSTLASGAGACEKKIQRQGEKINENVQDHPCDTNRDAHQLKSSFRNK